MRHTAEIKRSIVFCVKINLLISITPREPLLQHTIIVPALTGQYIEDTGNRFTSDSIFRTTHQLRKNGSELQKEFDKSVYSHQPSLTIPRENHV